MDDKQYCATCHHYELFNGVCCNPDSEWCADFRDADHTCEEWVDEKDYLPSESV